MKITLRNSVRREIAIEMDLDVVAITNVAFVQGPDAKTICRELFGVDTVNGLHGVDATDDDGRAYLVLLR